MPELLAPAGDMERLKIALLYGADAVYIGGKDYSLRANAKNFSITEIEEAIKYAHNLNKKVYVTVNIIFHDKDISGLKDYLNELSRINVDGIMFSDIVVLNIIKENNINLNYFLSTQASTLNYEAAKYWESIGVKRIVLAREALIEDIKKIKEETNLEVETFIHGAMCVSFSGKCVMSNYATNRDSNRGGCAQICRWAFDTNNQKYSMTPKDLNMVKYIESMIDIGIDSFKIEGRMRSIYYIATIVNIYKNLINKIVNKTNTIEYTNYCINILNRCANRDSTSQFYKNIPGINEQYFINDNIEVSNQDFLGIIKYYDKENNIVTIEQRNYFKVGDEVEFFGPSIDTFSYKIEELYDNDMNNIEIANHPQMVVKMPIKTELFECDMMRIKVFDKQD